MAQNFDIVPLSLSPLNQTKCMSFSSQIILHRANRGTKEFKLWYRMFQPPANPTNWPGADGWGGMRLGKFGVRSLPTRQEDWAWERLLTSDEEWAKREEGGKPQDLELSVSAPPEDNKDQHVYGRYVMFHTVSTRGGGACALEYIEIL